MTETQAGSTVPRRQLGRYLREMRNKAGLTVKAAAEGLEWSETKMWRIETGQISLRSLDAEAMCKLYRVDADTTEALKGLARETKSKGWWQAYGDAIPEYFDLYVGLEAAASRLSWYEQELIPGLLQTEGYARTLITADNPSLDEAEVDRRVQVRMARQAILRRPIDPPEISVVLNESLLRRPVGGPGVMAEQLNRLVEVSDLPNVSLRVAPFSVGFHPGILSGPFVILWFPLDGGGKDSEPPTVYCDGFTGSLYLDKPHEVERYSQAFDAICSAATDTAASVDLIRTAAEELSDG